jgi:glycerophosphoryl diester phosphodiesterase
MTPHLPKGLLTRPIAHRALHDATRSENGLPAIAAAVAAGYAIEIDLQPSRDDVAMVFHDATLDRMTTQTGPVRARDALDLGRIALHDGSPIPTLAQVLDLVAGRVPLLIEIKHQAAPPVPGALERATAQALAGYGGEVAVMSFDPQSVGRMAQFAPQTARGLTTYDFADDYLGELPDATRAHLRRMGDFDRVEASFISHDHADLGSAAVAAMTARGVPVLCWTIRDARAEARARRIAANITFEGYLPAFP